MSITLKKICYLPDESKLDDIQLLRYGHQKSATPVTSTNNHREAANCKGIALPNHHTNRHVILPTTEEKGREKKRNP